MSRDGRKGCIRLDTRWLYDFLAVIETGNFTRAAEMRNSSQAAFSRRIQALEHEVRAPLIDRSTYPLELTSAGKIFRDRLASILPQLQEAMHEIAEDRPAGMLRISMPYALAVSHIGRWVRSWATERLRYSIEPGDTNEMFTGLVSGQTDLLITWHSLTQPILIDDQRFLRKRVAVERVRPFVHRRLKAGLGWPGSQNAPVPLLAYRKGVYFHRLVATLEKRASARLHADLVAESHMADVLRDLAQAGMGVAWLPSSTVLAGVHDDLVPVDDDGAWSFDVDVMAYLDRQNANALATRLWQRLDEGLPLN